MKQNVQDALNDQINAELYSAYLYFSMSSHFKSLNLVGFANWMHVQAQEELTHALRMYNFVVDRGGRAIMEAIAKPPTEWNSALEVFEETYKHEQAVTERINKLVDLAIKESDHSTNNMLQWFVAEQVEEEASVDEILQKLKLIGDNGTGVFMIDQELGNRAFTAPATDGNA
jgi:ferritin